MGLERQVDEGWEAKGGTEGKGGGDRVKGKDKGKDV